MAQLGLNPGSLAESPVYYYFVRPKYGKLTLLLTTQQLPFCRAVLLQIWPLTNSSDTSWGWGKNTNSGSGPPVPLLQATWESPRGPVAEPQPHKQASNTGKKNTNANYSGLVYLTLVSFWWQATSKIQTFTSWGPSTEKLVCLWKLHS